MKDFNKLIFDLPSSEYHGMKDSFSSSQLKTMLEDPEVFHKKYITREIGKEDSIPAFDVGTYFHTSLLEPEKLAEECIVFPGLARRGKEWEAFKEEHKGKAILTNSDKVTADKLIEAVRQSPVSMELLKNSRAEVSAFIEVYVMEGEVFTFSEGVGYCLCSHGWAASLLDYEEDDIKDFGIRIVLKVRADALGMGTGIISDLKSTTGNAKKDFEMQSKVSAYQYDLSAALYLDVFTIASGEQYHTFVWIFASKDMGNCKAYRASMKNIMVGRAKWRFSVIQLAKYVSTNWKFYDEMGELDAPQYALEWLNK